MMRIETLVLASTAARILGCSAARVRQLALQGQLAHERSADGVRLFDRDDVQRLAVERDARKAAAVARD